MPEKHATQMYRQTQRWIQQADFIGPLSAELEIYKLHQSASLTMEKFALHKITTLGS